MSDSSSFSAFLIVSLTLLLTPGPAVLFVLARSQARGSAGGVDLTARSAAIMASSYPLSRDARAS